MKVESKKKASVSCFSRVSKQFAVLENKFVVRKHNPSRPIPRSGNEEFNILMPVIFYIIFPSARCVRVLLLVFVLQHILQIFLTFLWKIFSNRAVNRVGDLSINKLSSAESSYQGKMKAYSFILLIKR